MFWIQTNPQKKRNWEIKERVETNQQDIYFNYIFGFLFIFLLKLGRITERSFATSGAFSRFSLTPTSPNCSFISHFENFLLNQLCYWIVLRETNIWSPLTWLICHLTRLDLATKCFSGVARNLKKWLVSFSYTGLPWLGFAFNAVQFTGSFSYLVHWSCFHRLVEIWEPVDYCSWIEMEEYVFFLLLFGCGDCQFVLCAIWSMICYIFPSV